MPDDSSFGGRIDRRQFLAGTAGVAAMLSLPPPAYNVQDRPTMLLKDDSKVVNDYEGKAREFWAKF